MKKNIISLKNCKIKPFLKEYISKKNINKHNRYMFSFGLEKLEEGFDTYLFYNHDICRNIRSTCHKNFSTIGETREFHSLKSEKRILKDEYGINLRIRRNKGNIANPWDDYPTHVYDLLRSWKFNSKRKKQYKDC